ncbi:MAG: hypothetical protein AAGI91_13930 [Bacteroidota bacterium]
MATVFLAVAASLGYGASDFLAGRVTQRLDPAAVVLFSEAAQAAVVLAFAFGQPFSAVAFGWAAAAGLVNAAGLVLYYRALGAGPTGVVAPLVASSTALPAAVAVVGGTLAEPLTLVGLGAVIVGVVVGVAGRSEDGPPCEAGSPCRGAVRPRDGNRTPGVPPAKTAGYLVPAALATLALGVFFVLVDRGAMAAMAEGQLWVPLGVQAGALPLTAGRVLWTRRGAGIALPGRATLPTLGGLAALNLTGDLALAAALAAGNLGVVAVLASLGPAVTGVLGRVLDRERLTRPQAWGAALTLLGTLAVAASG